MKNKLGHSLHQHILRVNFESYLRKHATTPIMASSSPVGYGWKLEEDRLEIVWGTQQPAPESILEYVKIANATKAVKQKDAPPTNLI